MISFGDDKVNPNKAWLGYFNSLRGQWVSLAILTVLYVIAFVLFRESAPTFTPFIAILIILAGWYWGPRGALILGLLSIPLNAILFAVTLENGWVLWNSISWPGNIMALVAGLIAGNLRRGFDSRAQVENELRARERYLTLINITTQDFLTPVSLEDKYCNVISHLANLLTADYGLLILWDKAQEKATLVASTWQTDVPIMLDLRETNIISQVLQNGDALAIDNAANSDQVVHPARSEKNYPIPQSLIYIPLITKEDKLGVVILAFLTPHHFSQNEVYFAELACRQVVLALRNALQDIEIKERLRESHKLYEISQALSKTEAISLDHVLQLIANSARELIPGTQQAVIHLLDKERRLLIPHAVSGFKKPSEGQLHMRLGEGVAGQVIAEGKVICIADAKHDPRFLHQATPVRFRSLMVAPIQSSKERLGTISVQSNYADVFNASQHQLLNALGAQAAIAIENAHLFEATHQGLKEVNALFKITRQLVGSLETEQLMKDVVELLQQNFGYYLAEVFVIDPENEDLVVQHASGKIGELLKNQRLQAGAGIIGHAAETGEAFFTNDVDKIVFFVPHPLLPDTQSELAMPIKVNNRVLGVLDVQQCPPGRLTERDLQLVSAVAEQLAVALQKAKLYSDLQTSLQQEKAVRSQLIQSERLALVGRLLASVSHELNNPLQAIQNALFLLKEERGISDQGKQDLQIVLSETERMAALIERLRASYRPTRKEDFQLVQLNAVVEDVYALVATHLRHNRIAFEFHPDPNLPLIAGLPEQCHQVVLNLLMNAVEAMSDGGKLTVITELGHQKEVQLSVSDTGPGIDPNLLPHIFDAFVTSKDSGTGLGLTITYDIIHRHNGQITAENNADGGATFKFWLPIQREETE